MSLFVVIGTLTETGVIEDISALFVKLGGNSLFGMYSIIVWGSVIISAFIDNIPYVATMLPVVQGIAAMMGCDAHVLYFGLLVGATLGGNLTPSAPRPTSRPSAFCRRRATRSRPPTSSRSASRLRSLPS